MAAADVVAEEGGDAIVRLGCGDVVLFVEAAEDTDGTAFRRGNGTLGSRLTTVSLALGASVERGSLGVANVAFAQRRCVSVGGVPGSLDGVGVSVLVASVHGLGVGGGRDWSHMLL